MVREDFFLEDFERLLDDVFPEVFFLFLFDFDFDFEEPDFDFDDFFFFAACEETDTALPAASASGTVNELIVIIALSNR